MEASLVEVADFGTSMGRGLRTTQAVSQGECLLEIPSTMWKRFSAESARASILENAPDIVKRADTLDNSIGLDASQHGLFACHLAFSFLAGHPYVRTLPRTLNSPVFSRDYSDGDFSMHSPEVADQVRSRVAFYMRMHEELAPQVPFPLFSWGIGTILSRAVRAPGMPYSIIPILDFANHASVPDCAVKFDEDRCSFMLVAQRDIDSHAQIFIDYGANTQSPLQFMIKYGFTPGVVL